MKSQFAAWVRAGVSAVALSGMSASAFAAPESGSYVAVGAGLHMPTKSTVQIHDSAANPYRSNNHLSFAKGYTLNFAGGYKWNTGFRSELEVSYRKAAIDTLSWESSGLKTAWDGSQQALSAMANLVFDIADMGAFGVYLGGGAGF